jgi:hypothetical protein
MKIMVLSDLFWGRKYKVTEKQFDSLTSGNLKKLSNKKVEEYYNLVKQESPDILVLAGDITGDGFCGHGHHYALCSLIKMLTKTDIIILMISGNHDEEQYYNTVLEYAEKQNNVFDISGKIHEFYGLKFYGLPYDVSKTKITLKNALEAVKNEPIDFLIAHAELKRRTHLFDFKAKCIITGHFDCKLAWIDNKVFISHGNDWHNTNYSVLYLVNNKILSVKYCISNYGKETVCYEENLNNIKKGNKKALLKQGETDINLLKIENEPDNPFIRLFLNAIETDLGTKEARIYRDKELVKMESNKLHKKIFEEHGNIKYLRGKNYKTAIETLLKAKITSDVTKEELLSLTDLKISSGYKCSKETIADYLGKNILNYGNQ